MAHVALVSTFDDLCIGMRYICGALRARGHDAYNVSFKVTAERSRELENEIRHPEFGGLGATEKEVSVLLDLLRRRKTDVVGMGIYSDHYDLAAYLTKRIRESVGCPVVWGGSDVYFNPEDALLHADAVCLSEGEETMVDLVEAWTEGRGIEKVRGIGYLDGEGKMVRTEPRPRIEDLDSLPFPSFDSKQNYFISRDRLWQNERHPEAITNPTVAFMISGRGCPYSCTYCCNCPTGKGLHYGGTIRRRSVDNFIREAKYRLRKNGKITHFFFFDEVFTIGKKWIAEFCGRWKKEIGVPFQTLTYPSVSKPEVVAMLKDAGLGSITMGIQSGSERINRDVFGRKSRREEVIEACRTFTENGVPYVVELIHENPYEEEADYQATARLLNDLPRPYIVAGIYGLCFWKNFDITKRILADGKEGELRRIGSHTWRTIPKPEHEFWKKVYTLVSLTRLDEEDLQFVFRAQDDPVAAKFVAGMTEALQKASYRVENDVTVVLKDVYIDIQAREIARLHGSRVVQYYFGARDFVRNLLR